MMKSALKRIKSLLDPPQGGAEPRHSRPSGMAKAHGSTSPGAGGTLPAEELLARMPLQTFQAVMGEDEVRTVLDGLSPKDSWCHYYDLGHGITTIAWDNQRYLGKALSLKMLAVQICDLVPAITRRGTVEGLKVLDLACAEGQHAIELGAVGAKVLGIEGRQIYVDRANFVARVFGLDNVCFQQGDVRKVTRETVGGNDLVVFSGILHHLGPDDFIAMLRTLREVTDDTMFLYTHTSPPEAVEAWKLKGPVEAKGGYRGHLYREHPDGLTDDQKRKRLRSSLDNNFSFWAEESELVRALTDVGFSSVLKVMEPYLFEDAVGDFRVLLVCRV